VGHKLYIVDALVRIEDFNDFFGTEFLDEDYDTLGGLLIKTLGRLPKQEEIIDLKTIKFRILQADNRRLQSIEVKKID